jgi:5-methylcytosine-specific restriction endonuclease McrA
MEALQVARRARRPESVTRSCAHCATEFVKARSSQKKLCDICRDAKLKENQAKQAKQAKTLKRNIECTMCQANFIGYNGRKYCDECLPVRRLQVSLSRKIYRNRMTERQLRRQREISAPGLTLWAIRKLLKEWQAQNLLCFYCQDFPTTVDHVVPLIHGGTNYQDNLVPCCRPCNSSKSDKLLNEWSGRNVRATTKAK